MARLIKVQDLKFNCLIRFRAAVKYSDLFNAETVFKPLPRPVYRCNPISVSQFIIIRVQLLAPGENSQKGYLCPTLTA